MDDTIALAPYKATANGWVDWNDENGQDGEPDHTGIVEKVENGIVYTVEGNSGDSVRINTYPVGYYEIYGYGVPQY